MLLVMRVTYAWHATHIETLMNMGFELHLATRVPGAAEDGRFASVIDTPADESADGQAERLARIARELGAECAITFYETDIVVTSMINEHLGKPWANPAADAICRDKERQRALAKAHGLPGVDYSLVRRRATAANDTAGLQYPFIVKPTHLAASMGVTLVGDVGQLDDALGRIESLTSKYKGSFYTGDEPALALAEEYLPGREVTVDGVVLEGRFHLAGVINKMAMGGPFFEEDYYTLPYRHPEEIPEIVAIVQGIVEALGVRYSLINVELRQDAHGAFRIIEFSTRMSGGQNYLNLRIAHQIDVVKLYAKALTGARGDVITHGEVPRHPGRMATCIKFAYRRGLVVRNTPGAAYLSPHFRSYLPVAKPGDRLQRAPHGWYEIAGSLAVAGPYRGVGDLAGIERIAARLDTLLDLVTVDAEAAA